jgi:2-polyprenyl-6-hydroxyphenyl methylase / 3-demethylubiquinone-9 3-methyltransferase
MAADPSMRLAKSVDPVEIKRFADMAEAWWDPRGKFRALHRLNPLRVGYIRDRAAERFGRDPLQSRPLSGLRLLDVGCGGGLVAEPMTRLGANVVGADAALRNIGIAARHSEQSGLDIDYRHVTVEALAAAGEVFDVILCMEVVEHVADLESFLGSSSMMLRPGGLLIAATLNRTLKAFALAVVGAEYVLRWLPQGTHDWRKFLRPHELARLLRAADLTVRDVTGVTYSPLQDAWSLGTDLDINYMMTATKESV